MLAAIVTKLLTWITGRGLRILVQHIGDLLQEIDHREALKENARYEAEAAQREAKDATAERIDNVDETESDIGVVRDLLRARGKPETATGTGTGQR